MEITKQSDNVTRDKAGEALEITKDHSIEDVLKYHKEGYSLTFNGSEDDFIDLSDKDFARLPKSLMIYYIVALKERQGRLKDVVNTVAKADTPSRTFGYDLRSSDPDDQLAVSGLPKGMVSKWVRAYDDQIKKSERRGYKMARGDDAVTFGNDGTKEGGHFVGSEKAPELILMLTPQENFDRNSKRIKRKAELVKSAAKQLLEESAKELRGSQTEVTEY